MQRKKARPAGLGCGPGDPSREHAGQLGEAITGTATQCLQSGFFLLGFRNLRHNRRTFWTSPVERSFPL
jgi:hypothetical protein